LFIGEFHAHPRGPGTWAGQLPSPDDIVNAGFSVGGSMWPLGTPWCGKDHLDCSPEFQIVQSLLFGDLIVIERGPAWKKFADLKTQQAKLDHILAAYTTWHQNANSRLGKIGNASHDQFYSTWSNEVGSIGSVLGKRFSVSPRRNPG
jgi:hypothetical protein